MKNTALITGASGGIGLELARIHASKGGDLVLVARNKQKLDELKAELEAKYRISVYTIGKDLSAINAVREVYEETTEKNIQVDCLVNNAGFGSSGMFCDTDWDEESQMIQVNVAALTQFTKLYMRNMLERGQGRILNVCSTAAFQPGPMMSVYYASKAYVLSFSQAVANEVRDNGVTVTTLCPGPTASGFHAVAYKGKRDSSKDQKLPTSRQVAEYGYAAMEKGKKVVIHGFMNRLVANGVRFLPRELSVMMVRKLKDAKEN